MLLVLIHVCEYKTACIVLGEYIIRAEWRLVVNIFAACGLWDKIFHFRLGNHSARALLHCGRFVL